MRVPRRRLRFRALLLRSVDGARARALLVVLAALALTAVLAVYTARHLGIDTSTDDMIAAEVPFRQHTAAFEAAFPHLHDQIVIVVDALIPERAEEIARGLADALRAKPELVQSLDLPADEPFFRRHGLLFLDPDELAELADRLAAAQALLATLVEDPSLRGLFEVLVLALEDARGDGEAVDELASVLAELAAVVEAQNDGRPRDLSWRRLIEDDHGPARQFVLLQPALDHASFAPAEAAIRAIRAQARALGVDNEPGTRVRLTGSVALEHEELESVFQGAMTAGMLTVVLVGLLLVIGLGSLRLVLATLLTLAIGLIWTAAFATASVGSLNLISVAFAVLFVGLGVDFAIHLGLRHREGVDGGRSAERALREAAFGVGPSIALSALAAALGFYAFVPTDYKGLAELGIIAGSGMFIAVLLTLGLLPALLALFPVRQRARMAESGLAATAERFVERHRRAVLAGALALGLAALFALPHARFDFNPVNLNDPNNESVATFLDLAEDPDVTPYTIEVLSPDLDRAEALRERLQALDEVDSTIAVTSFVPGDQEIKLDIVADMALYLTPLLFPPPPLPPPDAEARQEALEQLRAELALSAAEPGVLGVAAGALEAAFGAFEATPEGLETLEARITRHLPALFEDLQTALDAGPVGLDDLPEDLRRQWRADDGQARISVSPAPTITTNEEVQAFADAVLAMAPQATGTPVVITEASRAVLGAFQQATVLALLAIAALLALVLRRALDVVLILTPLLLAGLLTIATTVVLDLPFNFANVIVLPLLLGLGVSSGIHLVRRRRRSAHRSLLRTSTPRAVLFSALTTLAAFGSLAVSDHIGMASMGQLLTIAIGWALLCTLVVLPSMMAVLEGGRLDASRG